MFNEYNDIITVDELCEMLHIGKNKAYHLLKSNKISSFKDGRLWMIPKISVIEYINSGRNA